MHKKRRRLIFYSVYSWSIPLIIALTGVVTDEIFEALPEERFWFDSNNKLSIRYNIILIFEKFKSNIFAWYNKVKRSDKVTCRHVQQISFDPVSGKGGAGFHVFINIKWIIYYYHLICMYFVFNFTDDSVSSSTIYLYGPIGLIIFINIIFFILTVNALYRTSNDTALAAGKIKAWQKYGTIQLLLLLNII